MRIFILIVLFLTTFGLTSQEKDSSPFVEVVNGELVLDGERYCFVGSNYWQGMNLGAPESGDRNRLLSELDQLQKLGVKNLRVLAASEADQKMKYAIHPALQFAPGQYDEDLWGINFWTYSGEGIPPHPGEYWKKGDIFTGDPPHELQGWYGVYSTDSSTLSIISGASEKINKQ